MSSVGAVILAAGMSRRMGEAKLFLPLHGKPLFRHAVERTVANGLSPILLIGGEHSERLRQLTSDLPQVKVLVNREYATGMAASLQLGVKAASGQVDAILVFLADQPYVPDTVIQALIQTYEENRTKGIRIVRPCYQETDGHPVLFDASLMDELAQVKGDKGGKDVIEKYRAHTKMVCFDCSVWILDVDTPDDYRRILQVTIDEEARQ